MEIERELLEAIDQLAADGDASAMRSLVALLACGGKVEVRVHGWQHPFREYAEQEGAAHREAIERLVRRGIVLRTRTALLVNSLIMSRSKDLVARRCANRLFARTWSHFAPVLSAIRFDDLRNLCRRQSDAAASRAQRTMGARFQELKRMGLLVTSHRTKPRLFPTMRYVNEVPQAAAVALVLEQGHALSAKNLVNDVGVVYHVALATACLEGSADTGAVVLTDRGREQAAFYVADTIQRRLRWIGGCRTEAMHFLVDELAVPLPSVWIDGTPSEVGKISAVETEAPLRQVFRDKQLRAWMRRLVRRLTVMGLARKIEGRDGASQYFFAPGVVALAKETLGLPEERFALPPKLARRGWDAVCEFLTTLPEPEVETGQHFPEISAR